MVPRTVIREPLSGGCGLNSEALEFAPNALKAPYSASTAPNKVSRLTRFKTCSIAFLSGVILTVASGWLPDEALARRHAEPEASTAETVVALSNLPSQAQDVYQRIHAGGPFRYSKDGVVFGNRERVLPRQQRGYYREYTVPTPGERNRGARRIVCGGKDARQPETCFYSQDHYQSFKEIDPRR
jgi:ribonuclease T1